MLKRLYFPEPELPPLTEPLIVPDLVITGAEIEAGQHYRALGRLDAGQGG